MLKRQLGGRVMECLEARRVLAGNVLAAVVAGNLVVTGDTTSNYVELWQNSNTGDWKVAGLQSGSTSPTTVNGQTAIQTFSGVTGGLQLLLGDGDDQFVLTQAEILGNAVIDVGEGFNSWMLSAGGSSTEFDLTLDDGSPLVLGANLTFRGDLSITSGSGIDRGLIDTPSAVDGDFSYTGNAGRDEVVLLGGGTLTVGGSLSVDLGAGENDTFGFTEDGSGFHVAGDFVGSKSGPDTDYGGFFFTNSTAANILVTGNESRTVVVFENSSTPGDVLLDLDAGQNMVWVDGLVANSFVMNSLEGDDLTNKFFNMQITGDVTINLGDGFNTVAINGIAAQNLQVTSGAQSDAMTAFDVTATTVSFDVGGGNDIIGVYTVSATTLSVSTGDGNEGGGLGFGLVVGTCTISGTLTVDSGAGLDNILLGSVIAATVDLTSGTDSDGVIVLYSQLGSVSIDSGDSLDIVGCHDSVFDSFDALLGTGYDQLWLGNLTVNNSADLDGEADGGELVESGTDTFGTLTSNLTLRP